MSDPAGRGRAAGTRPRSAEGPPSIVAEDEEALVEAPDRTVPPTVGPPPPVSLPRPRKLVLGNGLRLFVVERRDVPMVTADLQVGGGASLEDAPRAGLAALTADLLDEGTSRWSAIELADEIERLGATLSSFAGRDANRLRMTVLSSRLREALALFGEVVTDAAFDAGELERVRDLQLTRVLQGRDEPRVLADEALSRVLFGPEHAYGQPVLGVPSTVPRLTAEDVRGYYDAHYHAGNAALVMAGDVAADAVPALLESTLGSWAGGRADAVALPDARGPSDTRVTVVDRPGAPQSEIRVGRVATDRATPDYYALTVLNTILGGSFTSRLNTNLREDKGFTYGARSSFNLRRHKGPFVAGAAVHTPVTAAAIREILAEIGRIAEEPVPDDELRRAANFVALRLPQGFESVSDLASRFSELVLYDLPLDTFTGYVERVLAVSAADVQDAARRYLSGGLAVVVVGDWKATEGQLRALGLGPVERAGPE